mmetsp:Transcript_633/g.901  ORF Transcript_633/g.901 Transcript_633/m.901 type:complete len:116 (-) Transcript_633:133-480(-)
MLLTTKVWDENLRNDVVFFISNVPLGSHLQIVQIMIQIVVDQAIPVVLGMAMTKMITRQGEIKKLHEKRKVLQRKRFRTFNAIMLNNTETNTNDLAKLLVLNETKTECAAVEYIY